MGLERWVWSHKNGAPRGWCRRGAGCWRRGGVRLFGWLFFFEGGASFAGPAGGNFFDGGAAAIAEVGNWRRRRPATWGRGGRSGNGFGKGQGGGDPGDAVGLEGTEIFDAFEGDVVFGDGV